MWRNIVMLALSIAGTAVAAYLTWVHYSGNLALCLGTGGCEKVQTSAYSVVMGVPVALLGLLMYLALDVLLVWLFLSKNNVLPAVAIFGISLAGTLYSAYLTYLELYVIHAICPWCVTSAVIITLLFLFSTAEMSKFYRDEAVIEG